MAAELILILQDFFAPLDQPPGNERPRLPGLETLLARAQRWRLRQGWRGELLRDYGGTGLEGLSAAGVVAGVTRGSTVEPSAGYWLATPVHYFAGLDRVQLHPAGLLSLPPESQAALAADFRAVFGDDRWRLHATGRRELLLGGPALEAVGQDPARFLGAALDDAQPQGAGAAELRRLAVEIEMWLHEHSVNRQRQASAELPVSGLWFWGSEALPIAKTERTARAVLYGADTFAGALWQRTDRPCESLPESAAALQNASTVPAPGTHVVLYPTADAEGVGGALEHLERNWIVPALHALRSGTLSAVRLLAGDSAFRQRRIDRLRFWRTRVPWQEALV